MDSDFWSLFHLLSCRFRRSGDLAGRGALSRPSVPVNSRHSPLDFYLPTMESLLSGLLRRWLICLMPTLLARGWSLYRLSGRPISPRQVEWACWPSTQAWEGRGSCGALDLVFQRTGPLTDVSTCGRDFRQHLLRSWGHDAGFHYSAYTLYGHVPKVISWRIVGLLLAREMPGLGCLRAAATHLAGAGLLDQLLRYPTCL
jgi:hypothetical protein